LRGLSTDDLRLPFRAIGICVPASVGLVVTNWQTGEHRVDSIYVAEDTAIVGERYWHLLVCGERKVDALDDSLFHFGVRLPADTPLDKALDEQERLTLGRIEQRASTESTELYRRAWRRIFRWVMNVVIYATSAEARTASFTANKEARQLAERLRKLPAGGKRNGLKERLRGLDARRRTILGPNEPPMQVPTTRDGRGLAVRTLVTGHWRRQPHGPRNTLRKTIWIKPFWRGDDLLDESVARRILR